MKLSLSLMAVLLAGTAVAQNLLQPTQPAAEQQPRAPSASTVSPGSQSARSAVPTTPRTLPANAAPAFPAPVPNQPVQQSNFGPDTYAPAKHQNKARAVQSHDGIAPLPPLVPPDNLKQGQAAVSPFSEAEIVQMRKGYDRTRKAKAFRPVRTIPRISSITVDLAPGSTPPIARMLPGEMTTLMFLDATGAPWPLAAAPRVSDSRYFDAEWLKGTATVVLSGLSPYEDGNLSVLLEGFATPVVIKLATGEPDSKSDSRVVDYRLDLRIPGRAPGTPDGKMGPAKIALYDETMQRFLDGIPPPAAKAVRIDGARDIRTKAWALDGALFLRTDLDIQTAFDQSIAAGDGTRVYRLPPTPFITFSEGGRSVTMQLEID
ncbi:conjugal transfer protein TraN [Massilia atriviolacea]|uniref:Conjugal transfer protein TraN n=1 Tax=Massilia atriviolacea TaxID=2495579 RepID=A0A430HCK0_9BURK|nr:DotH/IcmK family type IV secretion protein [Massilia atriviolacea]RSZ55243.1 conjugal transfer protein TraN [Massilia atriviolacea]